MTTRGLPGFLRRTRRTDFEESDDDVDGDTNTPSSRNEQSAATSTSAVAQAQAPSGNSRQQQQPQPQRHIPGTVASHSNGSTKDQPQPHTTQVASSTTASPDRDTSALSASFHVQTLLDTSGRSATTTQQGDFSESAPSLLHVQDRRLSYRESQFSKILNAPVVKLPELRKLAWNGIPVRPLLPS